MSVTWSDYIAAVQSNVATRKVKIELLDSNENVIGTISPSLVDGSVQKSSDSGSRRSANITLENSSELYIPNSSYLWINSKFHIYTGYEINGEDYYISQGIYTMGEPDVSSFLAEKTVILSLYDKWTLMENQLESEYIVPVGSNVADVVKQIFTDALEPKSPIIYPTTATTPYTIVKNPGDRLSDILLDLCKMITYVCYYDQNGFPRFEPPTNISSSGSVFDFSTSTVNFLGGTDRYDFPNVFNNIIVYGMNINSVPVKGTASDTNPLSDTRVALIGKRNKVITDENIYTTDLANQRASYELQQSISIVENLNAECIIVDHLEGDNVCSITDDGLGLNGDRFLIKSTTIPLVNNGNQSLQLWKARTVS